MTRAQAVQRRNLGSISGRGNRFLSFRATRPALGLTQPPIQLVPWVVSLTVKRLEREADHSPTPTAGLRMIGARRTVFHTPLWRVQGDLYLYLLILKVYRMISRRIVLELLRTVWKWSGFQKCKTKNEKNLGNISIAEHFIGSYVLYPACK